jgi:hypothetical protein
MKPKLTDLQREVLKRMAAVEKIFPQAWLSFWPRKRHRLGRVGGWLTPTMVALNHRGLVELDHFIGYRLTDLGRAAIKDKP